MTDGADLVLACGIPLDAVLCPALGARPGRRRRSAPSAVAPRCCWHRCPRICWPAGGCSAARQYGR
ncbi:hypothetical protein ACFQY5_09580 [Paeniroseomonas aquatica]|uniref:hypothetical protein n=1 Tax=Paeniroseomonas aquatica TaxID=373043 RepID=UPI00361BF9C7